MEYYLEAKRVANLFGCRVGIFHIDNDGPGRAWEWKAEGPAGFSAAPADIVCPDVHETA